MLVALPPLAGLALLLVYLVVEGARPGTFTAPRPATIPEAIVVGNGPRALEMIAEGVDVDARALVRRGMMDEFEYEVTPLEAALMAQRIEVVRLLLAAGARVDRSPRAACLAHARLPEALPVLGLEPTRAATEEFHACFAPASHGVSRGGHWPVRPRLPQSST
jgi:hypothetical protein